MADRHGARRRAWAGASDRARLRALITAAKDREEILKDRIVVLEAAKAAAITKFQQVEARLTALENP